MENQAVNRFVSTLAGAFRSFYIYNQDNKAFDEILQNLAKRFQDTGNVSKRLELIVTNRSLLFEDQPTGYKELTVPLASLLRNLGYKAIRFHAPVQARQFFQLFHILTFKESTEAKNEKLIPFMDDDEPKPISLVPLTVNSYLLKLSDETISRRLAPLAVPRAQNGTGLVERLSQTTFANVPDLMVWIFQQVEPLPSALKNFVRSFIAATQEGYFPMERFLKLFPMPEKLRQDFRVLTAATNAQPLRESTPLGHAFKTTKVSRSNLVGKLDWISRLGCYSEAEIKLHREARGGGMLPSPSQDLDLAEALLKEPGQNFTLGASLLIRTMAEKNSLSVQEKALRMGVEVWLASNGSDVNAQSFSFLSSLRHQLVSNQNVSLVVFPLRNVTVEASLFADIGRYLRSLGKACLPALLGILADDQDRSMRKKLCLLIGAVAREDGSDIILQALPNASPFLLRNLVMILGDLKISQAVPELAPLTRHPHKIVRSETVRTLCKIGGPDARRALTNATQSLADEDLKKIAADYLAQAKEAA